MAGESKVVAIAGPSCSGKTLIAQWVARALGKEIALILPMDAYYADQSSLSIAERVEVNFDHPDALDWTLLTAHVQRLARGEAIDRPEYDFTSHTRIPESQRLIPRPVVIVEGVLALHCPELRESCALTAYVNACHEVCLERRLIRDQRERGRTESSIRNQYEATVRPMADLFVTQQRAFADLVLDGEDNVATSGAAILGRIRPKGNANTP